VYATIEAFARDLRARRTSAVEMTDECLRRCVADNSRLNAFVLVMRDQARQQAREADRELAARIDRGPLHGAPISIKDIVDLRGTRTTAASRVREGHCAVRDAEAVARLRRAGAVFIGKTNLHEFAFGTTNEDSAFGPSRNPHDVARSPGGSSGGSAASVAAGMALATLGTDTGGSVRIPAAACGIVGLKPEYGEVPIDGVVPLSPSLDHVGPLAATVTDTWCMYHALLDTKGHPPPLPARTPADLRLAIPRQYFLDLLDPDVRSSFDAALAAIVASGSYVADTAIPSAPWTAPIYLHIVFGEAAACHARSLDTVPHLYTRPVRLRLELARYVLAEDYVRAQRGRAVLRSEVDAALAGVDALILPTLPIPAPVLGESSVQIGPSNEPIRNVMLRLTQLFNLTGHPAISLPCGRTSAGLPCGLQLVGRKGGTAALLGVARAVEQLLGR
jgi:aspartyl-tRNA(Asn)/glutamyl-tRNA(Gln) amidotransferase subunit A